MGERAFGNHAEMLVVHAQQIDRLVRNSKSLSFDQQEKLMFAIRQAERRLRILAEMVSRDVVDEVDSQRMAIPD